MEPSLHTMDFGSQPCENTHPPDVSRLSTPIQHDDQGVTIDMTCPVETTAEDSQTAQAAAFQEGFPGDTTPVRGPSEIAPVEHQSTFFLVPQWPIMIFLTPEQYGRIEASMLDWEHAVLCKRTSSFLREFFQNWWRVYGLQGLEGFFEDEQDLMITYTEKSLLRILTMRLADVWQQRRPEGEDGAILNLLEQLDNVISMIENEWPSDMELGY
ncbi:hypothetical protein EDD85DRAFT_956468 [Armillaria nabsnona]|nr:hypothetical protein EDD85DRAFT_956468 [Armillaria nabsnona]